MATKQPMPIAKAGLAGMQKKKPAIPSGGERPMPMQRPARRPDVMPEDVMTEEGRARREAARQAVRDMKDAEAARAAYDKAMPSADTSMNYKKGGSVGSASKRADGVAERGKTRGKMV